jgi:hypothetical protein
MREVTDGMSGMHATTSGRDACPAIGQEFSSDQSLEKQKEHVQKAHTSFAMRRRLRSSRTWNAVPSGSVVVRHMIARFAGPLLIAMIASSCALAVLLAVLGR